MDHEVSQTDIAIVGMAARLPDAPNVREFWKNLKDGHESVRILSDEELLAAGESAELLRKKNYVKSTIVLSGMENFDGEFFGFSPKESAILDPQHRHFMECTWEALEDAGHVPESFAGPIGVFAGCGAGNYYWVNILSNRDLVDSVGTFLLRHTGNDKDFLTTRVSYLLNLKGPSINIQTACSSSLVAVHTACQSLISGECDMAIAGGVTILLPHGRGYLFHEGEVLSPDGHCHAFDHRAKGTIFGSGTAVVVLRRLSDALEAGDHIYAVIKGSAVNNDGAAKVGYLAPSVDGQAACMAEAYALAQTPADSIGYIECHGTGTYMGDPIEVAALTQAFRRETSRTGFCRLGSVKTNIGHLDTAAGTASLVKAALSLYHKQIPASLNFEKPNPTIDFEASPFVVNDKLYDWPRGATPRRAAVNSLGVGGTNAHVVLEEPPPRPRVAPSKRPFQLIALSGRQRGAVDGNAQRLAEFLKNNPEVDLGDVAYTLLVGRRAFEHRRVLVARDREEAIRLLSEPDPRRVFSHVALSSRPNVVFMFPGGGAQYIGMGRGLYESEPVFREWMDRGFAYLKNKNDYDLKALLFSEGAAAEEAAKLFQRPGVQLPALFLVEYALAKLLLSQGVKPTAMIGHSMGENTAACVAGVMSFEDALGLVHLRGILMDTIPRGGMISVSAAIGEVQPLIGDELDIACLNAPELCVISGPDAALDAFSQRLTERGIEAQRVPIDIAAHSRLLEPMLAEFGAYLRRIKLSAPEIPFISNRTGTWITEAEATNPQYWVDHLRHTIRFGDGITTLAQEPGRVYLEVGPGKTLGSLTKQNPGVEGQTVLNTLRHAKEIVPDGAFYLTVMGRLWALGMPLDRQLLWPNEQRQRIPLPTYAFQHKRCWIEPGKTVVESEGTTALSKIEDFESWFWRPVWNRVAVETPMAEDRQTWLVFVDEIGVGDKLVTRLRERGHRVVTVRTGDGFHKLSDTAYQVAPEHGRDGYSELLRDLLAAGVVPTRIAHLWLLCKEETFRPGSSFFHRNQERGFYSLLHLAQAIGSEDLRTPLHISVFACGMQRVAEEPVPYPDQATVLGPCKVIPREYRNVTCSVVDVQIPKTSRLRFAVPSSIPGLRPGRDKQLEQMVDAIDNELRAAPRNALIALRGESRWEQSYAHVTLANAPAASQLLKPRGVYVITGGLGGIGTTIAEHLAKQPGVKLVLLGRSSLPKREEWSAWCATHSASNVTRQRIERVRALEAKGAEVVVLSADVTDVEAMREALAETRRRFGAITGVIHASGIVQDGLMQMKKAHEIESVFAPKIHGTRVLEDVLRDSPPEFLVLFSSTSTVIAAAGQVDYVAANAYLNAYAESRAGQPGPKVIALNWGVWNEVGMAAQAASRMGGAAAGPEPVEKPATHRFFLSRREQADRSIVLTALVSTDHWMLNEHRTKQGEALIPGTGYVAIARAALTECGEHGAFELSDLLFARPLFVKDGEQKTIRVKLTPNEAGYAFALQSQIDVGGRLGWLTHAQANIALDRSADHEVLDVASIAARCDRSRRKANGVPLVTDQEEHLKFGPRWGVLRDVAYGQSEAMAELELPASFAADLADYPVHPALLDIATGYAMQLIEGYDPKQALWVPLSYKSLRASGPMPRRLKSWVRNHGMNRENSPFAHFDVAITDENGNVLLDIEQFTIRKITEDVSLQARPPAAQEIEFEDAASQNATRELSPAEVAFQESLRHGILPEEGARAFERALGDPLPELIVSSIELQALLEQAGRAKTETTTETKKFERPDLSSEYVAPRDDVERTLVEFWEELLGVKGVGVKDSFFDLGGHSLIAVRLFAKVKRAYQTEFPISVLFEAPTVESCAELIRTAMPEAGPASKVEVQSAPTAPARRFTHVVAMHPGEGGRKTPFFLVSGMFGNVLNLRHLAHLIGTDRPFYGLQARGLYGGAPPHETFEEMARDYLVEVRQVQPKGPYLLGGFSGGGLTAYEMAKQLREAGEEVAILVLLDTPVPQTEKMTMRDKMTMHLQNLQRQGAAYVLDWARKRYEWERDQARKREGTPDEEQKSHAFHSEEIAAAFYRALERYRVPQQPITPILFRPKLNPAHELGDGRAINAGRQFLYHDNGWGPFVPSLEIREVPGDHDSMVLEPNVRVLAAKMRQAIERAEQSRAGAAFATRATARGADARP